MRNQQRQVEQRGHDGASAKAPALHEVRDRGPAENTEEGSGGRSRGGQHEGTTQLGVSPESCRTFAARGDDELGYRRDEEQEQQRAEKSGKDRGERTRQRTVWLAGRWALVL